MNILNNELTTLKISGEIILFGGASMCLVYDARTSTKDIDALYEPKTIINQLVKKIAESNNLRDDWLNDSIKGFISRNYDVKEFITLSNLKIYTVSPQYLLAMKLLSGRDVDYDDIKYLISILGLHTSEEVYNILLKYYPNDRILPKTQYIIEEIFLT
ncbi:MAG: DUF6036 family nucleotidyltransferase [bacterium]